MLLSSSGVLKLIDFGFAKIIKDRSWTLCGTPEYLAPEILMVKGQGKGVDWWALGVLLYEMLAGQPPFDAQSEDELFPAIPIKVYRSDQMAEAVRVLRTEYTVPSPLR